MKTTFLGRLGLGVGCGTWALIHVLAVAALTWHPSPGRHVADASLWSAMVCMLALFRIEKTDGSENVQWTKGLSSWVVLHSRGEVFS